MARSEPESDGVTWDLAATEILASERRRGPQETIRISDPATAPQILAKYGLTRETAKRRTRLLTKARRGDPEARRTLRRLYACTVYQRPEVEAASRR